jgi:hypothetical protein
MRDLDFIIPSALVDPALAPELLRGVRMPHLARLLTYAATPGRFVLAPRAPLTTWQAWLFAWRTGVPVERINLAELRAMTCGMPPARDGGRWVLEPAHFKIARDHLRLTDPLELVFTLAEARALIADIAPVLAESGWHLEPVEPATLNHWLVTRNDGLALSGAAIERAVGDNVAAWQPHAIEMGDDPESDDHEVDDGKENGSEHNGGKGDLALAWRRCVNEIQMLWFGHPVNEAREAVGQLTINTLWLSGNGLPRTDSPHYVAIDSGLPLLAALPIEPDAACALESFDGLIAAAQADDWSPWRDGLERLDARFEAILREQAAGRIGTATFAFCGRDRVKSVTLKRGDTRRFWRAWAKQPALAAWFAEDADG